MAEPPIVVEIATRPCLTEPINGDACHLVWSAAGCRISVIDGLGHGQGAAEASSAAKHALERHAAAGPEEALRACHLELRTTRGAAISIAAIDVNANRLTFGGIGNVEATLYFPDRAIQLPPQRGIVGKAVRTVTNLDVSLAAPWMLLAHTDGVKDRIDLARLLDAGIESAQQLAQAILMTWGRPSDDATVLVATSSSFNFGEFRR